MSRWRVVVLLPLTSTVGPTGRGIAEVLCNGCQLVVSRLFFVITRVTLVQFPSGAKFLLLYWRRWRATSQFDFTQGQEFSGNANSC